MTFEYGNLLTYTKVEERVKLTVIYPSLGLNNDQHFTILDSPGVLFFLFQNEYSLIPFIQGSKPVKTKKVYCKNNSVLFRESLICSKTIKEEKGTLTATVRVVHLGR